MYITKITCLVILKAIGKYMFENLLHAYKSVYHFMLLKKHNE